MPRRRAYPDRMPAVDPEVRAFIDAIEHAVRRRDAETLLDLMARATGEPARMAYKGIVGFGTYHYRYESGREGDAAPAAFAPRKPATTIYLADGIDAHPEITDLGPHTTGVGCLYLKDLEQVDVALLEKIVGDAYARLTAGVYGNRAREGGATASP